MNTTTTTYRFHSGCSASCRLPIKNKHLVIIPLFFPQKVPVVILSLYFLVSRKCLPFRSTWVKPFWFVGLVLLKCCSVYYFVDHYLSLGPFFFCLLSIVQLSFVYCPAVFCLLSSCLLSIVQLSFFFCLLSSRLSLIFDF